MRIIIALICIIILFSLVSFWNWRRYTPALRKYGKAEYKIEKQTVNIKADGRNIYGEILKPEGKDGKLPAVICCHGYASTYTLCENMAGKPLASRGYAAICCDFCGGSKKSKSDLSMKEMSVITEKEDLLAIIDYVKTLDFIDTDNLFLLGESQGGLVSAVAAPERAEDIKAMVLYYPALNIPDLAHEQFESREEIAKYFADARLDIGKRYYEDAWDIDVYKTIASYDKPVLILLGTKDNTVPIGYGEDAAAAYPDAKLEILEGEVHGFTAKGKVRAFKQTLEFLNRHIG